MEVVQRAIDSRPLSVQIARQPLSPQRSSLGDQLSIRGDSAVLDLQAVAIGDQLEELRAGVDQQHPGTDQGEGPGVRIGAIGGGRGVERCPDPTRDQLLGGDPVEIAVVDHRDVPRPESLHQVLGAPAQARGSADCRHSGGRHRREPS
jgi:hypothetical protein